MICCRSHRQHSTPRAGLQKALFLRQRQPCFSLTTCLSTLVGPCEIAILDFHLPLKGIGMDRFPQGRVPKATEVIRVSALLVRAPASAEPKPMLYHPLKVSLQRKAWGGTCTAWKPRFARGQGPISSIRMHIPVLSWVKGTWRVYTEVIEIVSCVTKGPFLTALTASGASCTGDILKLELVHGILTNILG